MRQAGRSLPEYKAVRGEGSILNAIADADRATEITLQPIRRYGVDAAILYSDIVTPVHAVGFGIDIKPGVGPVTDEPFRSVADLARLRPLEPEVDTPYVIQTIKNLVDELTVPLIGFAGAPFTVASYLVEGGPSKNHGKTKALMLEDPTLWARLVDRLADIAIASLTSQVEAGASAIQLFDSWAGNLSPRMYEQYVLPASARIFAAMAPLGVPMAHFGVNTGELLPMMAKAGASVIGVDWRTPLASARAKLGNDITLQGNLDPATCLASWPLVEREVRAVLASNDGHPAHIFNLGHGVLPEIDPGILEQVVALVHEEGRADGPGTPTA